MVNIHCCLKMYVNESYLKDTFKITLKNYSRVTLH